MKAAELSATQQDFGRSIALTLITWGCECDRLLVEVLASICRAFATKKCAVPLICGDLERPFATKPNSKAWRALIKELDALKSESEPRRIARKTIDVLVFMAMLLIALPSALSAQQQPEPKPLRFDFTPFIGYRTSMSFPVEPHVTGTNPRVVLDASPSYGGSFGMRLKNEDDLVEIRWARQDSYVHGEEITPQPPRQRVILDQFHGDFSHEAPIEDWASWARPFVLASVGATHISNSTNISFTRFSFGIGGGVRFYASRHLALKIQGEWLPVFVDPNVAFICGSGCIVHVGGTARSQGEVFVGTILRF